MLVRVDKSAICKAFCAISGHILGPPVGVRFWWLNHLLRRRFGFNLGDVRIFIFLKNHMSSSAIFAMSTRVGKSAICKVFCAISGHIWAPLGGPGFWRLNRPFVRRFGFNFDDVRIFIFFLIIGPHPRFRDVREGRQIGHL